MAALRQELPSPRSRVLTRSASRVTFKKNCCDAESAEDAIRRLHGKLGRERPERFLNAPFSQHCKTKPIVGRSIVTKKEAPK